MLAVYLAIWAAIFGGFGAFVAAQKGRDVAEGVALGAIFGPLGVVVVALLPTADAGPKGRARRPSDRIPEPRPDFRVLGAEDDPPESIIDRIRKGQAG